MCLTRDVQVFDPLYVEISEFLESMISVFALSPLLFSSSSCFGTSSNEEAKTFAVDMDPVPGEEGAAVTPSKITG